jgi:hypothetical protein
MPFSTQRLTELTLTPKASAAWAVVTNSGFKEGFMPRSRQQAKQV